MGPPEDLEGQAAAAAAASAFGVQASALNDINEHKDNDGWTVLGGLEGVAAALRVSLHDGVDTASAAAGLEARRAAFGANTFKAIPPKSFFKLWLSALKDPTLIMLMVAALVSTVLGVAVPAEREDSAWTEGVAIWVAVLVVSLVGAFNDWNKDRQFQKLNAQKDIIEVKVIRAGQQLTVPNTDVVVGDVMILDTGDKIIADGYVTEVHGLVVDEASLTGESDPVKKGFEPMEPWVRSGTQVTEGSGRMLVLAVGENSEWGRTMALVVGEASDTPLQEKLGWLAAAIGKLGLFVAVVCFIVLLVRWCIEEQGFPMSKFAEGPLEFFIFSVTILVVAVPEGLPLAVTISLAYSMKKMMKDNNFVRVMAACETMGGATAICSDKTGTLTENRMTVVKGYFCGKMYDEVPALSGLPAEAAEEIVLNAALNSKAFLVDLETGQLDFVGNRTECALLVMARNWGQDYKALRDLHHEQTLEVYGFSSERKMASVLVKRRGVLRLYNKGAAEMVLTRCVAMHDATGASVPMTEPLREELLDTVTAMASTGLRTLCLAYTDFPEADASRPEDFFAKPHGLEHNLTMLCIVGIKDPVRKEVPAAVATCQRAGITVRMVTGDNIHTAQHIARECGILTEDGIALEGPVFRALPEEQLLPLLPKLQVLARSSPKDKYILVQILKKLGEVVAVTGDGTNDAPALKESDVGLAMGIAGTEVAKEAADIVIMDDNFSSIVKAVLWGRSVFTNIRKFLQFQLTINLVALIVAFVAAVTTGETPLNVLQLLWVNLIMDSLAALALATEAPTPDLLEAKPHGRDEPLISHHMWRFIFSQGMYQCFWLFLIFYGMPAQLSAFYVPSACDWYKVNTAPGFCCTPGTGTGNLDCSAYYGAVASQPGFVPVCEVRPDGSCHIDDPSTSTICPNSYEPCQYNAVHTYYDQLEKDYENAREDAIKGTNSMVFNTFIWCQMANMINARKVGNELNVFNGLFASHIFWVIWVLIAGFQVIVMFLLGGVFKVEELSGLEWAISILIGLGSFPLCLLTKLISRALPERKRKEKLSPTERAVLALQRGEDWEAAVKGSKKKKKQKRSCLPCCGGKGAAADTADAPAAPKGWKDSSGVVELQQPEASNGKVTVVAIETPRNGK
ncbi:P-type ATPase [Micractinium conductrix]|uniref:Calcium-transporting ATPase n=1 Tax=Micractinium conductrix TaxID=554055 RepID=A0A2P6VDD2_9CHLO|nr:P-type ATPase [Micractinium conductrix]|eukprot:PSC72089.1 P-type ATPase [Micractinium conductrix]